MPMTIHRLTTPADGGEGRSIKSTLFVASKEKETSDRLTGFMGLLFASTVFDANGVVVNYKLSALTDKVKDVFESVTSTTDQARMIGENLTAFSVEVADEKVYLPRCTRYPFLLLTLLTYLMHINLHLCSIDGYPESLKKTFKCGGGNYGHGGRGDYDSGGRGTSVGRNGGNGEDKRKRDGGSGAGDIASGSIINTTERNIRMPSGLKQKYCSHFVDTSKTCDFGSKCKHTHAHYPSGFDNVDLQPMLVLSRILED